MTLVPSPCLQPLLVPFVHLLFRRRDVNRTAPRARSFGLAPQLVAKTLEIVQPICNDNNIFRDRSLHRTELFRPRSLLCRRGIVDRIPEVMVAREYIRLVIGAILLVGLLEKIVVESSVVRRNA